MACAFSYFELRQCRPKLGKLKRLLNELPYKGELQDRSEDKDGKTRYTYNDLLDKVQASEEELKAGLKQLQACLVDGYWRVFHLDYRDQVFQSILTLLEEEDWSWKSIPLQETCQKLEELEPPFVLEHVLDCYGVAFTGDEGEKRYGLEEDKVCQFCAELFLRQSGKFNYEEFMESWPSSVPLGMTTSLDQLKSLALTDLNSVPAVIWYFPATDLPEDPAARFSKLFSVKEKWAYDEMHPYISDLESPGQSLNGLLLKYSRVSVSQGKKTYSAKLTAL
ncbi:PREDICTED: sister chromatid cohesion protein DCC1-like [Amphimedon queenslandica]|uniref:Sister chromatid cohesion protein DCC1 n=1 Tax=Amphimedon queenslandica TaxID=400682 RepID=A0A1X7UGP6_AMPQE|nr:PREDICTED: sister chromatid cohesion protein DCC1-like [Amphimedon queenslandica]|eukprot:XP_019854496.1 PREDICTED: sister chromatid cohesion protein DCC1-like [Amphimedon queenslandica]